MLSDKLNLQCVDLNIYFQFLCYVTVLIQIFLELNILVFKHTIFKVVL